MYISDMISRLESILEKKGDLVVIYLDDLEITSVKTRVAKKNEFPADYNMPKGFEYVIVE